jgi:hypothetical protein
MRGRRALPRRAICKVPYVRALYVSTTGARGCNAVADTEVASYEIRRKKALDMNSVGGSGAAQGTTGFLASTHLATVLRNNVVKYIMLTW